jgi:drug/metabolite transporter (DMT)-like permease
MARLKRMNRKESVMLRRMNGKHHSRREIPPAGAALVSALLFGITTPVAKQLLDATHPLLVAGLLYAGSGIGLTLLILIQERGRLGVGLVRSDLPWFAASVVAGGVLAPALLMFGLSRTDAATSSLLLNLEVVFTAAIAWFVFHEATSRRVVLGFLAIFVGSVLLVGPGGGSTHQRPLALVAIAMACLCWAIDNNLTRKISAGDARAIAAVKGLVAGATNTGLAFVFGATLPTAGRLWETLVLGFLGYGVSLVLFVYSLRNLGTARTGAYFATAPFIGSALAILLFGQTAGASFWFAAGCMALGVWLHLTETHEHEHLHKPLEHTHPHSHDDHHQHEHPTGCGSTEPHTHEHRHEPMRHGHPHFPDIHHEHTHE